MARNPSPFSPTPATPTATPSTSSQRGGTYDPDLASRQKVKDLLLEIERDCAAERSSKAAAAARATQSAGVDSSSSSLSVKAKTKQGAETEEERKYRAYLKRRREARHKKLLEQSFVPNFSARTVERRPPHSVPRESLNDPLYYDAELDKECPLAWARRLNRLEKSKRKQAVGAGRGSNLTSANLTPGYYHAMSWPTDPLLLPEYPNAFDDASVVLKSGADTLAKLSKALNAKEPFLHESLGGVGRSKKKSLPPPSPVTLPGSGPSDAERVALDRMRPLILSSGSIGLGGSERESKSREQARQVRGGVLPPLSSSTKRDGRILAAALGGDDDGLPTSPSKPPISFQPPEEHSGLSLQIIKLILGRAVAVSELRNLVTACRAERLQRDEGRRKRGVATSDMLARDEEEEEIELNEKQLTTKGGDIVTQLRGMTVTLVEWIMQWAGLKGESNTSIATSTTSSPLPLPTPTSTPPTPYLYKGENYLLTILHSLDFLDEDDMAKKILFGPGFDHLKWNPFLSPIAVRRFVAPSDAADEADAAARATLEWADADAFFGSRIRIVAVPGHKKVAASPNDEDRLSEGEVDILQLKDVSTYFVDVCRGAVEVAEAQERDNAQAAMFASMKIEQRQEQAEAEAEAEEESKEAARKANSFFKLALTKYAEDYFPKRNVMGEIDPLTKPELMATLDKKAVMGTSSVFSSKANDWVDNVAVELSSVRRGTFFGTLTAARAQTPETKMRRVVESVAMLQSRERMVKTQLELESLINVGVSEEDDVELLKGELELIRGKANNAKDKHNSLIKQGASADRLHKVKLKWTYWYDEQAALAAEIKARCAKLFTARSEVSRLVRTIDRLKDDYESELKKSQKKASSKAAKNKAETLKRLQDSQGFATSLGTGEGGSGSGLDDGGGGQLVVIAESGDDDGAGDGSDEVAQTTSASVGDNCVANQPNSVLPPGHEDRQKEAAEWLTSQADRWKY